VIFLDIKFAVFDLDGTILNTIIDLANAVNYALGKNGFEEREVGEFNMLVGNGQKYMCENALREQHRSDENIDKVVADFNDYYKDHSNDETYVYDGILDLVKFLKDKGIYVGVYTNKPHVHAMRMIEDYFGDLFDMTIGNMPGRPAKPDPIGIYDIMGAAGAKEGEGIYFGDSGEDIVTAINGRCLPIGVLWGFRQKEELLEHGAKILISHPDEFYDLGLI